ncbi:TetR/AcrR family transcriptional regulator [Amycolatopsis sp. K13G38]|uniref:TetR/AcrR family transcriptional regulator n=1 Tax=Amycolatopsis acididurans TaxID=2724524 RepID=A0ABX1J6D9_9PSEU|nr:TetR/AcrR family transcriptional regulator [Amycolatopsis acididurans]NKQ55383.1 TetR/AcrR family transcriptional regulator [Amycolatopsis acididurans]
MATGARAGRKRRPYAARVPAEQRRAQLLDAALHLIVTQGHNAVTMEAVAEQVGVTKPVVYGVFANRADLLAALLRREQQEGLEQLLSVLPERFDEHEEPARLIAQALDRFLQAVRDAPERWYCIVMPMADMPVEFHTAREQARAVALARAEDMTRRLLGVLGAAPGLDPEIAAHTLVTVFEMAARLVLTDPDHFHPTRFTTTIHATLATPTQTA